MIFSSFSIILIVAAVCAIPLLVKKIGALEEKNKNDDETIKDQTADLEISARPDSSADDIIKRMRDKL